MTELNPYDPPSSGSVRTTPAGSVAFEPTLPLFAALACYPLPFLASFAAWFAYPFFYFTQPIPVFQGFVVIASLVGAIRLTRTLTKRAPAGGFLFVLFGVLYTLAILATGTLALTLYSALGFRDPMP